MILNLSNQMHEWTFPFQLFQGRDLLDSAQLERLLSSAPTKSAEKIAVEDPRHEKQYRMNLSSLVEADRLTEAAESLPEAWSELLRDLMSPEFTEWLESQTGIELSGLERSIGIYTHRDGDYLSVHKDKLTKAITSILYLNTDWPPNAGGRFQLFTSGDRKSEPVAEIPPTGGQLLAFKPTESSWHAVSPIARADGVERVTVQVEYWLSTELMGSAYKAAGAESSS
jgi:Rps23 Pro-64 3,4-dihydroxylase Tpa1-like proline 4-hydroxylase